MKLPKSFRVGTRRYKVEELPLSSKTSCIKGAVHYVDKTVDIGSRVNGRRMGKRERATVFWHEAIHAMLYDMGSHNLNNNEQFVENLAKRITDVVYTARF
jgi:hypothetical protein